MNTENTHERTIDAGTNVRLPVGLLASFMVAVAIFLYSQDLVLHSLVDKEHVFFASQLEKKADKSAAGDRYTGKEAGKDKENFQLSITALQREHIVKIEALEYSLRELRVEHNADVKHLHDDIHRGIKDCTIKK